MPARRPIASPSGRAWTPAASFGYLRGRPPRVDGRGDCTARRSEKDGVGGRDANGVGQPQPMQHRAKQSIVAKFRIRQDARDGEPARPHLSQQRQRLAPFFLKRDRGGDARPLARRGGDPLFGQIQRGPEQIGPGTRPQRGGDRDLTIGDLPQRPAILARHADRVSPLFGKARAVENQQAFAFGHHRPQATPDCVGIPRRIGDEVLERLVGSGLGHPRQHRFHRLARAVAEQPLHVPSQRKHLRAVAEAHLECLEPRHQPTQLIHRAAVVHRDAEYRTQTISTMSSNPITCPMRSQTERSDKVVLEPVTKR